MASFEACTNERACLGVMNAIYDSVKGQSVHFVSPYWKGGVGVDSWRNTEKSLETASVHRLARWLLITLLLSLSADY